MRISVLNGSPYGLKGITAQYIKYLEIMFPEHSFRTIEVARQINKLEHNIEYFNETLQQITTADAVVWAFPVYTMWVPSQLKLFIELLFNRGGKEVLKGKIATAISSSANFYDHTAHDYIHGISIDLGLRFVRGFSAEMKEILSDRGKNNFLGYAKDFFWRVDTDNALEDTNIPEIKWNTTDLSRLTLPESCIKTRNKNVVIISDANREDYNLLKMIELFERLVSCKTERIDLNSIKIAGGCIGCLGCGNGDSCFYKDDYSKAFEKVQNADIVIYAGAIKDRYYSARFKKFIDRYFSNGHRHVLKAGLLGHIVSGPLSQLSAMRETLEAHIEVAHCQRLGIISDDHPDPAVTEKNITDMVHFLEHWIDNKEWQTPPTFLGVGGGKIFRDLVYENRGVMSADYRFYKEKKLFDFPNKNYAARFSSRILMIVSRFPSIQKDIKGNMNNHRIRPYKKMLEKINTKNNYYK